MSQYVENGSRNKQKNQIDSNRQTSEKLDIRLSQGKDLQDDKDYMIENNKHSKAKSKKEEKENILSLATPY